MDRFERDLNALKSTNLFLVLGKYVERQAENLLTQALVLLFNRVAPFRKAFSQLLFQRASIRAVGPEFLVAQSQVHRKLRSGRIFVDMEVRGTSEDVPLFLIESKLDAGLGPEQLKRYGVALNSLPNTTRVVVLTRYGTDEALWRYTPRNTIWISWPIVAEVAALSARQASRLDQLLLKDFLSMAELKGIYTVPGMTIDSLSRLAMFRRFTLGQSSELVHKTIRAVDLAMMRLLEHRDAAWESSLVQSGRWQPYQSIFKWEENTIGLEAGYYRMKPRPNVQTAYLYLGLICGTTPRLYAGYGWQLSKRHPRYDRAEPFKCEEGEFDARETKRIFQKPMPAAIEEVEPILRPFGRAALKLKSV